MISETVKRILKEELNKSDEARIKKLARDEFDKMIKKHLKSDALEEVISDLVIKNIKKDRLIYTCNECFLNGSIPETQKENIFTPEQYFIYL